MKSNCIPLVRSEYLFIVMYYQNIKYILTRNKLNMKLELSIVHDHDDSFSLDECILYWPMEPDNQLLNVKI